MIVKMHIKSIQRHNQYSTQRPLLLSSPEQPEGNDVARLDGDADADIEETAERDRNTSSADDTAVIITPPTVGVDEETAVSMPLAPNPITSTTESPRDNTNPTKEKKFVRKLLEICPIF
jgi:aromatic ring-opening dioxygenase LigB subunit